MTAATTTMRIDVQSNMSIRRNNSKLLHAMMSLAQWPASSKTITTDDDEATMEETETSESSSNSSQCRVVVGLATTVRVRYTLSRDSYTPDEKEATWYTRDQYQVILKQCNKQIEKLNRGKVLLDQKYCARGVERHTKLATITRTQNKKQALEAVLTEQRRQKEQGILDEEAISDAYRTTCSGCQRSARLIGNRDRQAIEDYLDC